MDPKEQLKKLRDEATAICNQVEAEKRDLSDGERARIGEILTEGRKLRDQLRVAEGDAALRAAILELGGTGEAAAQGGRPGKGKSLGERFVESEVYKEFLKRYGGSGGRIPESTKGISMPAVEFKDLITGLGATSAGVFVDVDHTGIYEPIGRYPLTARDLFAVRQTTSDTVEYVQQTVQVREAAPTPEANVKEPTGATGEITGEKPQGSWYAQRAQAVVKTIAVYVGVTKRALSDAAQIRGIIDQELREDLDDELETQLFTGDGVGENFTGLANQAGTLVQAFNTNALITCRQAITTLLVTGRTQPTAFVFHPIDWEAIDLLRDTTGRFLRGDPFGAGPKTLWGVPVVESFHIAQGSAWVANWRKGVIWDRQQSTISATDSHSDWFIRNIVAILAELRAAFGLIRPSAFVNVELA